MTSNNTNRSLMDTPRRRDFELGHALTIQTVTARKPIGAVASAPVTVSSSSLRGAAHVRTNVYSAFLRR